jgi:hypothetical protein
MLTVKIADIDKMSINKKTSTRKNLKQKKHRLWAGKVEEEKTSNLQTRELAYN